MDASYSFVPSVLDHGAGRRSPSHSVQRHVQHHPGSEGHVNLSDLFGGETVGDKRRNEGCLQNPGLVEKNGQKECTNSAGK